MSSVGLRSKSIQFIGELFDPPRFWLATSSLGVLARSADATYFLVGTLLNDESSLQSSFLVVHREQAAGKVFFASHASWKDRSTLRTSWGSRGGVSVVVLLPGDIPCNYWSQRAFPKNCGVSSIHKPCYLDILPFGSSRRKRCGRLECNIRVHACKSGLHSLLDAEEILGHVVEVDIRPYLSCA